MSASPSHVAANRRGGLLGDLGALRVMLVASVGALAVLGVAAALNPPSAADGDPYRGWRLVLSVLAPPVALMSLFVVGLDMLMTRVLMSARPPADGPRLRRILIVEAVIAAGLVLCWLPFFVRVLAT